MKIPKLRPTYAMLLQHAWMAPLVKPPTITEEDEEEAEAQAAAEAEAAKAPADAVSAEQITPDATSPISIGDEQAADREVAEWVSAQLEKKRNGLLGKKAKPALHAAPLDAVPSPRASG